MKILLDILLKLSLCLGFAMVLGGASARAQSAADSDSPSEPLLAPAPDFSMWVVTFSYTSDKANNSTPAAVGQAPPPSDTRTRMVTTTKTREIIHEQSVDGAGSIFDLWHVRSTLYMKSANSTLWGEIDSTDSTPGGGGPHYEKLAASGFRSLDWISKDNYIGTIKASGNSYLIFAQGPSRKRVTVDTPLSQVEMMDTYAVIDSETRLPVQVQAEGVTRAYQFKEAPTQKLELPPDLTDQLRKAEEGRKRLNTRMPQPY